jgi:hypothetical protein
VVHSPIGRDRRLVRTCRISSGAMSEQPMIFVSRPAASTHHANRLLLVLAAGAYVIGVAELMMMLGAARAHSIWPFLIAALFAGALITSKWALALPFLAVTLHGSLTQHVTGLGELVELTGVIGVLLAWSARHLLGRLLGSMHRRGALGRSRSDPRVIDLCRELAGARPRSRPARPHVGKKSPGNTA